jgi:hypothetical protein
VQILVVVLTAVHHVHPAVFQLASVAYLDESAALFQQVRGDEHADTAGLQDAMNFLDEAAHLAPGDVLDGVFAEDAGPLGRRDW